MRSRGVNRAAVSATALAIAASGALAFGATSAWAAGIPGPTGLLGVLAAPAGAKDLLPADSDGGRYFEGTGLRYESTRHLGTVANATFWAAIDERDHVCLVEVLTATGDAAMSCVTPERFAKSGVSISVASTRDNVEVDYTEAYLVPDSLRFADLPSGLSMLADNLVAGDSRGRGGPLTASTLDGRAHLEILLVAPPMAG